MRQLFRDMLGIKPPLSKGELVDIVSEVVDVRDGELLKEMERVASRALDAHEERHRVSWAKKSMSWLFNITVVSGILFYGEQHLQRRGQQEGWEYGVPPQPGLNPAKVDGHFIFSGDGLTGFGELSNIFAELCDELLGYNGKGYGARDGGASFKNLHSVKDFPLSVGFVQEDLLKHASTLSPYDLTQPFSSSSYFSSAAKSGAYDAACDNLSHAASDISVISKTEMMEAVFLAHFSGKFETMADLNQYADDAARGLHKPLKIACPSSYTTGSYYTGQIIAQALNPDGITILDCLDVPQALKRADDGDADIALFVEHPGEIRGEVRSSLALLKKKKASIISISDSSYDDLFHDADKVYYHIDVTLPWQDKAIPMLGVKTIVVGVDLSSRHVERHSYSDLLGAAHFRQEVANRIKASQLKVSGADYKVLSGPLRVAELPLKLEQKAPGF